MSSGLYNTHKIEFDTTLDLTRLKPYGDTMNDGKVQLSFNNPAMKQYDGVYTAVDTGGAIVGNKIDLFMGDYGSNSEAQEVVNFGVQSAKAVVL